MCGRGGQASRGERRKENISAHFADPDPDFLLWIGRNGKYPQKQGMADMEKRKNTRRLRNRQASVLLRLFMVFVMLGPAAAEQSETITYYHTDGLGSVIAASDEAGNLLWRERYRPFGERMERAVSTDTHALYYTGKPHDDDTHLTYFGARYYDPVVGRFMGIDPAGIDPGNLHSFNRYAYANNNPYRYRDPDGRAVTPETVFDVASLGLSIADFQREPTVLGGLGVAYDGLATAVPFLPAGVGVLRNAGRAAGSVADATKSATVYRQGTFADDAIGWQGNYVKGKQWANDNPLTTPDYAKKYGLPAENTGKPDWVIKGRVNGPYSTRPAPGSHNNPANTGGGREIIPDDPSGVRLDWFHMPD